jgi:regulator of sigma E protease
LDAVRNLLLFALVLGGLIAIHELGHFAAALRCGVRVKEFGLGLPPRLWTIGTWRGTRLTVNWVPLGGFVRPEGEFDPSIEAGLAAAPAPARILVFAAGPLANFLIGYLVLTLGFMTGWPDRVTVASTLPGHPAEAAGLKPDDILLRADGKPLHNSDELTGIIYGHLGRPIVLDVERAGQIVRRVMTPKARPAQGERPAGVNTTNTLVRYPLPAALQRAAGQMLFQVNETLALPARLLTRERSPEQVRFSGVVGLKQTSDRVVENAVKWNEAYPILHFTAVVSIALGLTNLLPLPALDGGRIAFALLEIARGKRVSARREKLVHAAGMLALLGLMLVLAVQDVINPLF